MNLLKMKKLHPKAIVPTYGTEGAACFDLYAIDVTNENDIVTNGNPKIYRTGWAFEIPKDHVMLVFSRSGQGFKSNIRLANCVGVIDADYRGELMVKLSQDLGKISTLYDVKDGDRIAQAMIIPVQQYAFEVVDELSSTVRGENGCGSTGK